MTKKLNPPLTAIAIAVITISTSNSTFAGSSFNITPAPGYSLPTIVYPGSTTHAFYTVTNQTSQALYCYNLNAQPNTVSQHGPITDCTIIPSGTNCSNPVTLNAGQSCLLQLDITGTAISSFGLCNGPYCSSAAVSLNVQLGTGSLPMIAAGYEDNVPGELPLLAQSSDGGATWTYPDSIPSPSPGVFEYGFFNSSSCSENYCIAAGEDNGGEDTVPLLAQSSDGGVTWNYPPSIDTNLPTVFWSALFRSANCSGNFCIAAGNGYDGTYNIPCLAQSSDGGGTWTYPATISTNYPAGLNGAGFNSASCSSNFCVAAGNSNNGSAGLAFLAQSSDGGITWIYPTSITTNFPGAIYDASFNGASCNGSNCVAAGFNNNGTHTVPLLAQSSDGGLTWIYPVSIANNFPGVVNNAYLNSVSCSGNNCVAAGSNDNGTNVIPLLAQSSDGGLTWTYPVSIANNFPGVVNYAYFNSVSCSGNNCVAAGSNDNGTNVIPLLAQSTDGGLTWTYPVSIANNFPGVVNDAHFNSVSCSDINCVAAGYNNNGTITLPLLAQSSDGGFTWTYPSSITTALPEGVLYAGFNSTSVSQT